MTSLTISPKLILTKIFDLFQPNLTDNVSQKNTLALEDENFEEQEEIYKPKLQVTIEDLKVISTALLHFRRQLRRKGETEKAKEVGEIDSRFYELITYMEENAKGKTLSKKL